jgi:hypothetical protein
MSTQEQIKSLIGETYFEIKTEKGAISVFTRKNGDVCESKASPHDISEGRRILSVLKANSFACKLEVIDEWVEVNLPAPACPLAPCVSYLREYIRHEDSNGYCNFGEDDWDMGALTATLRGYFESFVVDARDNGDSVIVTFDSIPNYEDRLNAFAVLERAESFGPTAYAGEFMRLAPYILRNVSNA